MKKLRCALITLVHRTKVCSISGLERHHGYLGYGYKYKYTSRPYRLLSGFSFLREREERLWRWNDAIAESGWAVGADPAVVNGSSFTILSWKHSKLIALVIWVGRDIGKRSKRALFTQRLKRRSRDKRQRQEGSTYDIWSEGKAENSADYRYFNTRKRQK